MHIAWVLLFKKTENAAESVVMQREAQKFQEVIIIKKKSLFNGYRTNDPQDLSENAAPDIAGAIRGPEAREVFRYHQNPKKQAYRAP